MTFMRQWVEWHRCVYFECCEICFYNHMHAAISDFIMDRSKEPTWNFALSSVSLLQRNWANFRKLTATRQWVVRKVSSDKGASKEKHSWKMTSNLEDLWLFEAFEGGHLTKVKRISRVRTLLTLKYFAENNIVSLPHLSFSPDLALSGFYFFLKMKTQLNGHRFNTVIKIKSVSQNVLDSLTINDFQSELQKQQECWDRCITAQGDYFESYNGKTCRYFLTYLMFFY